LGATSRGRILAWRGGSLWIGRTTAETGVHAHHAIQVTLALDGAFRLGPSAPPPEAALAAAIVAPDRPHAFIGQGLVALVFVEPELAIGRAILARHCPEGLGTLDVPRLDVPTPGVSGLDMSALGGAPATLLAAWCAGDEAAMAEAARAMVAALAGPAPPRRLEPDPRVVRLVRQLAERPEAPPSLAAAAAGLRLSPGRLRHLFVAETGLHYRGYVLWLRLERAVREMAAGNSLTEAAHVAGFADSAHLSRTFRRMFGLAPSSLRLGPDALD
jgi:AraC family transcriptional regulator